MKTFIHNKLLWLKYLLLTIKQEKRSFKTVIRKKRLQFKYFIFTIFSLLSMMGVVILTIYITFLSAIEKMNLDYFGVARIKDMLFSLNSFLIIETIVFVVIAGYFSLRYSHKIAGPLHRLEKIVRQEIDGEPFEIKIRKDDELHDLVEELNELIRKKTKK
ncbi:MAG: hypothetical protein AB1349_11585 [Elusimicrobiota bacterium]